MPELSKINEFSGLVSQAAKLGKKSITLSYEQSMELMHEINTLLVLATKNIPTNKNTTVNPAIDGGNFKN
jgi:hypothetical protein